MEAMPRQVMVGGDNVMAARCIFLDVIYNVYFSSLILYSVYQYLYLANLSVYIQQTQVSNVFLQTAKCSQTMAAVETY